MTIIDIRENTKEEIDCIIFYNEQTDNYGYAVYKLSSNFPYVWIESASADVLIENKEHAQNLIKALNKAIELGWLK